MGLQSKNGKVMKFTMFFTKPLALALGLGLSASFAQTTDWCIYQDASGKSFRQLPGECLFMGSQEDLDFWGKKVCGGRAKTLSPAWNDRITAVKTVGAARKLTLYLNVMKDENVFTQAVDGDSVWNIPTDHPIYSQASVAICE